MSELNKHNLKPFRESWLEGVAHGYEKAMDECIKSAQRKAGAVGGRNCVEIREAIDKLHFEVLCERYPILKANPSSTGDVLTPELGEQAVDLNEYITRLNNRIRQLEKLVIDVDDMRRMADVVSDSGFADEMKRLNEVQHGQ